MEIFEHESKELPEGLDWNELNKQLDSAWKNKASWQTNTRYKNKGEQAFLRQESGKCIKGTIHGYVGIIVHGEHRITVLPKIFKENDLDVSHFNEHFHYWLKLLSGFDIPPLDAQGEHINEDLLEFFVRLFVNSLVPLLIEMPYHTYVALEEDLPYIKGRFKVAEYVSSHVSTGNWQKLPCEYEDVSYDNKLNQLLKFVCRMLLNNNLVTNYDTKTRLEECLNYLTEVSDIQFTYDDCDTIHLLDYYSEYRKMISFCKVFLSGFVAHEQTDLKFFSLLIPMPKVFEKYVEKQLMTINCELDKKSIGYLTTNDVFRLLPDFNFTLHEKKFILDCKYKIRKLNEVDNSDADFDSEVPALPTKKLGVSQADAYQLSIYALKYQAQNVILCYPKCNKESVNSQFDISLANYDFKLHVLELPVCTKDIIESMEMEAQEKLKAFLDKSIFQLWRDPIGALMDS
jgi:5-methylcytosine-specific restriction enzyme subunit McrC